MSRGPTPEKKVEQKAKRWARDHGWYARKFTSPSQRSVPDDLFLKDGKVIFIEFKREGETPTPAQWVEIDTIRKNGGHADWADDAEIAIAILRGFVSIPAPDDRTHPRERLLRPLG